MKAAHINYGQDGKRRWFVSMSTMSMMRKGRR